MSTSLTEDTSPESVTGKKGKRSPGTYCNIQTYLSCSHRPQLAKSSQCSLFSCLFMCCSFFFFVLHLQLLQSSCLFLPPHSQTSDSLHRGGTLSRRRPPPMSFPLWPRPNRAPSLWYVNYRSYFYWIY